MKRSQSSATDIILLKSSSSDYSIMSLPQTNLEFTKNKKLREVGSQESVISVEPPQMRMSDKENVPPRKPAKVPGPPTPQTSSGSMGSRSSTTNPLSSTEINRINNPELYKLSQPRSPIPFIALPEWDDFLMRSDSQVSFPRTSTKADIVQPKPKAKRGRKPKRRERSLTPESSESETEKTITLRSPSPSVSRSSSACSLLARSDAESCNPFESETETALSDHEEAEDQRLFAYSSGAIDALLTRFTKPESALEVAFECKSLDHDAFFDLLMNVQAIDFCINEMYCFKCDSGKYKSITDLQELLFEPRGRTNLSHLVKSILMDSSACQSKESGYFTNMVRYLLELCIYAEKSFLCHRVFDMKLNEIYEASGKSITPVLSLLLRLCHYMMPDEEEREKNKKLNLAELHEQRNDKKKQFAACLTKHELAPKLLQKAAESTRDNFRQTPEQVELADRIDSVESLSELDPVSKVEIIRQLVEIIMYDGLTYRSYIIELQDRKTELSKEIKAQDDELKAMEAKYQTKRPARVDESTPKPSEGEQVDAKEPKFPPSVLKKYKKILNKYHKDQDEYELTKQSLTRINAPQPVYSVTSAAHFNLRVNMWSFDSLMPNFLLVEKRQVDMESQRTKSTWFQISNLDLFVKSLSILLPAAEYDSITKALRRAGISTASSNSPSKDTNIVPKLAEFYAMPTPKKVVKTRSTKKIVDDEEEDTNCGGPAGSAELLMKEIEKLRIRIIESGFYRHKVTLDQSVDTELPRYHIELNERLLKLLEEAPVLVKEYQNIKAGPTPDKNQLLRVLGDLCVLLLDSVEPENQSARFSGAFNLANVLHDYILLDCRSLESLRFFVAILSYNIRWEKSVESSKCAICQEAKRSAQGELVDGVKLKCSECNVYFHFGCLSYEEQTSRIYYFIHKKLVGITCSACLDKSERDREAQVKKKQELHSVDVNDYKLRSNRTKNYNIDQALYGEKSRKGSKLKRSDSSSSSSGFVPVKKRLKKEDSFIASDESDDDGIRSKRHHWQESSLKNMPKSDRSLRPKKAVAYNDVNDADN